MKVSKIKGKKLTATLLIAIFILSMIPILVSADVTGTIELDADWYKTGDIITVTIEDADKDIIETATQDESGTIPGTVTVFTFSNTDIEFDYVGKPYDMRGDQYLVQSVNDALGQITLQSTPPGIAELMASIAVAVDLSLDVQPTKSTVLKLVMSNAALALDAVVITGIVDGSADSEIVVFGAGQMSKLTTKIFDSVDAGGIDASGYLAGGDITIKVENLIFADYTYYEVDTFEGSVISSVDAVGVTPLMTETGPHTGIFEGTLVLAGATDDGVIPPELKVADADTITAVYADTDPIATITASATIDDTAPSLDNQYPELAAEISDTTPVVSVDVIDFESGVLGTPALAMDITGPGPVSPVQTEIANGYNLEYHVGTVEALTEGTITVTITGEDLVGNPITPVFWTFELDLTTPTMDSAATATTTTIDVTFSEGLDDTTVAPEDFLVDELVTPTDVAVVAAVVTLTVPEMPTDDMSTVELVGALNDIAGNELTEGKVTASDGIQPTVAIAVSPDPCGAETATFDLTFSETMNTVVDPTVAFTDTGGSTGVTGDWISTTAWQGTYDISGLADQEFPSVVTVTLGQDLAANVMEEATGSFDIDTLVDDPTFWPDGITVYTDNPIIRIDFGEIVTVTAATFDEVNVLADLTTTDDQTYRLVTEDLTHDGDYTITVSAEDALGNELIDASATFTIALSMDINLIEGWNLISLPLIPDDPDTEVVLADVLDNVMVVYGYNQYNDEWIMNPEEMTDGYGYWLYLNEDDVMTVEGKETIPGMGTPATYEYTEGWVLGGYKEIATGTDYFDSFEADTYFGHVYVYDASELAWSMVPVTDTMDLNPGQGFWIWMYEDQVLIPPII